MDTRSTCCNAPITYLGVRLVMNPFTGEFEAENIYTCDGCGNECERDDEKHT